MRERRRTRQVRAGNVRIGGAAPVSIQSMAKVKTAAVPQVVAQIRRLERCGCEIVRVAVKDAADAAAIRPIRSRIRIPVVADIHFDHRLALASIAAGADKVRINPGTMRRPEHVEAVVAAARRAGIPIRIGVNSGSVQARHPGAGKRGICSAEDLVRAAMEEVRICEKLRFRDIVISLKASSVPVTVDAYRLMARRCDYPLHLGVTASGPRGEGIVRSAAGIGALLLDGIGDTVRVSLTAEPEDEVVCARRILAACGIRRFGPEIVSCPTCGRCQVDLVAIVDELEAAVRAALPRLPARARAATIAVMGCEVNGPGEAREADIGIAAGKGSGALFIRGRIVRTVAAGRFVEALVKELGRFGGRQAA